MKTLVAAVSVLLAACVTTQPSADDQTIEQFVSDLSGKEIRLHAPMSVSDASVDAFAPSAAGDAVFGYAGLRQVYAPAYKHCEAAGGTLHIAEPASFSESGATLPARFGCRAKDNAVWEFAVHYREATTLAEDGRTISLIPKASFFSAADIASRTNREGSLKAAQPPQEKDKAKLRPEVTKKTAVSQAPKSKGRDELKLFRKNLKVGDRVQWKTGYMHKGVGKVVQLNGDLALVQYDNQASAGLSVRYFNRAQLEPFDGAMPVRGNR